MKEYTSLQHTKTLQEFFCVRYKSWEKKEITEWIQYSYSIDIVLCVYYNSNTLHAGFSSWCTLSHSSVVDLSLVRGKMVAERKYWREPHLHCRWKGECFGILTGIQLHTSSRQSQEDWEYHNWCRTCKFTRLNSVAVMHEELKVDAAGYGVNSGKHYSHSIHNITCIMCFQSWIHNNYY